MQRLNNGSKIYNLVMTAMMMCLILVATSFFKIPVPMTQGYVHLGDAMIFLAVLLLGTRNGAIAAGFGSALGDILGGYAFWAPWTLAIKFLMALLMGLVINALDRGHVRENSRGLVLVEIIGMIVGGLEMCAGYFIAERFLYGNWAAAAVAIPWNIGQFTVGIVVACVLSAALCKTPARKYFTIRAE
ncbi:MAG: ECF transporter S component [Anaerovoracaceae bacterium]|jgi:uncharacterized membrane protein